MNHSTTTSVTYDAMTPSVRITALEVNHPTVTSEALRWSTGVRGPAVAAGGMDGADLTAYVEQALAVGAQAITVAGGAQDTYNLEQLVQDVGTRTSESTTQATESTTKVVTEATKAMQDASAEAKKALREAGDLARSSFATNVSAANKELREQLTQLLGGKDPELVARLQLVLKDFGTNLTTHADEQSTKLYEKATRALNPDDPTSPLAKHMVKLDAQHTALTTTVEKHHETLAAKVQELATALNVQKAAAQASAAVAQVTTLKGRTYEENISALMRAMATGLGDEYTETGNLGGALAGSKKGDGLLTVDGGRVRVLVEMHDSRQKRAWNAYLDEAERNRQAAGSLGLVPTTVQNEGQSIRVLSARRVVMAFDPLEDDPALLRTVLILLRTAALAASARLDDTGVQTAAERIAEALDVLPRVDTIRKLADGIRKNAVKVDTEADTLHTVLNRLLLQAQTALHLVEQTGLGGHGDAAGRGSPHSAA